MRRIILLVAESIGCLLLALAVIIFFGRIAPQFVTERLEALAAKPAVFQELPSGCTLVVHRHDAPTTNVTNLGPIDSIKKVEIRTSDIVGPKDATFSLWSYNGIVKMFGYNFKTEHGKVWIHAPKGMNGNDRVVCP